LVYVALERLAHLKSELFQLLFEQFDLFLKLVKEVDFVVVEGEKLIKDFIRNIDCKVVLLHERENDELLDHVGDPGVIAGPGIVRTGGNVFLDLLNVDVGAGVVSVSVVFALGNAGEIEGQTVLEFSQD